MTALHDPARDLYVVPIRHHSPACAAHLLAMIDGVQPAALLIEGPCDFDPLIPLVANSGTRPPVAIVGVDERKADGDAAARRVISYFPFCAHSPEYVALKAGVERSIPVSFIDLPASDRAMRDDPDGEAPRLLLTDEHHFDSGDYIRALARDFACRDGNEVWDHLFESRLAETDWQRFFHDVGTYCDHIRAATAPDRIEADGTLAREAQMRALVARTRAAVSGPILAIVGGFHASALMQPASKADKVKSGATPAYLVRYGHRQLNALSGYSAGLPLPAYYERLWEGRGAGVDLFAEAATSAITGFAAHLRDAMPGFAPPFPVMAAALENAHRLAALRGRPGPMREDVLDALRSTLLKGEEHGDAAPVMAELMAWMTGSAIGEVPPSAGSPPLVEAVRAQARRLGFTVADGERRNRDLDIYRNEKHRAASRFLHGLAFLEAGFGQRTAGPDFRSGVYLDRLHEIWSVMWSPLVEARLIERAADADTLEEAVAVSIVRRLEALKAEGKGQNATAAITLFVAAVQAGVGKRADAILPFIAAEVIEDPDLASVAEAVSELLLLWRGALAVGLEDRAPVEDLARTAWRRALFLLPNIAHFAEDQVSPALGALVALREAVELADGLPGFDPALFDEAVSALLDVEMDPALSGAVHAIAYLGGRAPAERLSARMVGELGGAWSDPHHRVAWLRGVLIVSRELFWAIPELLGALDAVIGGADEAGFEDLLPHLRLAFSQLDPRDIARLARQVADMRGGHAEELTRGFAVSEQEHRANQALDHRLAAMLAEEGLL